MRGRDSSATRRACWYALRSRKSIPEGRTTLLASIIVFPHAGSFPDSRQLWTTQASWRPGVSCSSACCLVTVSRPEKRNPLRFPPGGDRLPHIVRPRTRCERSELLLSLTGHGAESPLAAWLSRSFPRPLALRPAVTGRFALSRESGR